MTLCQAIATICVMNKRVSINLFFLVIFFPQILHVCCLRPPIMNITISSKINLIAMLEGIISS